MNIFNVRIIEDDGDTHIYTGVTKIDIINGKILVDYENDERAIHSVDRAEEIVIKRS